MKTYPANKAKKSLEAIYPLEWEEKALTEVIQGFQSSWGKDRERFEELSKENESINAPLPTFESESKELIALNEKTFRLLILREPFLYRILAYISLAQEDQRTKKAFFEKYLHRNILETYYEILTFENILEKSELAKSHNVSGIPLHSCFVGKVLKYLLDKADSQRMSDFNIPECMRVEKTKNGLIFFYLNEADYKSPLADEIIDDILYKTIVNSHRDRRQRLFFGKDLDNPEYKIIKRFRGKEKKISFQMLPKYAGLIRKTAKKDPKYKENEDVIKKGIPLQVWQDLENKVVMLFLEAVLDQPPEKTKPAKLPFSAFIKNQLLWRTSKEWEDKSIQINKKRISKEALEHECESLDDWLDQNDEELGRRSHIIKDGKAINPENNLLDDEQVTLKQKLLEYLLKTTDKKLKRLMQIHTQKGDVRLSDADQKFYSRNWNDTIKKLRDKFHIPI